jgi:hypothetical protein
LKLPEILLPGEKMLPVRFTERFSLEGLLTPDID